MAHKKMSPEVKRVWINELRSGRYKQTDGVLRRAGSHCCLGVLCDMSKAAKWEPYCAGEYSYAGANGDPPSSVREWAGLTEEQAVDLARRNDCGATFTEIADWIEKHL